MPAKEIKDLRKAGKIEEAFAMAKAELEEAKTTEVVGGEITLPLKVSNDKGEFNEINKITSIPDAHLLWPKRNLSWVLYDWIKLYTAADKFDSFKNYLMQIEELKLPADDKMLYDQMCWQIGKMIFSLSQELVSNGEKVYELLKISMSFHYTKPSEVYSFLFKAFHKALKISDKYIEFADWWDFANFRDEDFQKEKLPNGKEIMPIAEQAYICYSKKLLEGESVQGEGHSARFINAEKVQEFLLKLNLIIEKYSQLQYPVYYKVKMEIALARIQYADLNKTLNKEKIVLPQDIIDGILNDFLPFARKKKNDFWVWDLIGDILNDEEKTFACCCRALNCISPEEMLINLRQKMAVYLIKKQLHNEAKTEIEHIIKARNSKQYKIPDIIVNWENEEWYKNAKSTDTNINFYKKYTNAAEEILFGDFSEESVIVEFVNSDKKILNFIASEAKFGFFKYDRFLKNVKIGDILKVRFQGGIIQESYNVYTISKGTDDNISQQFIKEVQGEIRIVEGKTFGFINDVYCHPSFIKEYDLKDKQHVFGRAIRTFNKDKKVWAWKVFEINL